MRRSTSATPASPAPSPTTGSAAGTNGPGCPGSTAFSSIGFLSAEARCFDNTCCNAHDILILKMQDLVPKVETYLHISFSTKHDPNRSYISLY